MYSRSFKEYLADIDVCMGGRVAEELGTSNLVSVFLDLDIVIAYGSENVTSGASSDITKATHIARSMVKASWPLSPALRLRNVDLIRCRAGDSPKRSGRSTSMTATVQSAHRSKTK